METTVPKKHHQTITTTVESFLAALKASLGENKSHLPILMNVLIQNQMAIGTTLDSFTLVPFEGKGKADFIMPRKPAIDLLTGEKGPLTITFIPVVEGDGRKAVVKTNGMVYLQTSDCEFSLATPERKFFPNVPIADKDVFTVPGEVLKPILKRTLMSISKEESRYTLNAALFHMERVGRLIIAATDGHRLALHEIEINGTLPTSALVIPEALTWVQNNIGPTVHFGASEAQITITTNGKTIISKRNTGKFPDYRAVMPKNQTMHAEFDSPEKFKKLLAKVGKAADERSGAVRLSFNAKALVMTAGGSDAGAKTSVECSLRGGQGFEIGLNFSYLVDFLASIKNDKFEIGLKDPQSAVTCKQDMFTYILMPMRI